MRRRRCYFDIANAHQAADAMGVESGPPVDEIGLLAKSANALLDTAEKVIDKIQAQYDQMEIMATHDPLTGLPVMRLATDHLQVAISSARRTTGQVALLFLDLDAFKAVNDTFDHDTGDAVLKEVA